MMGKPLNEVKDLENEERLKIIRQFIDLSVERDLFDEEGEERKTDNVEKAIKKGKGKKLDDDYGESDEQFKSPIFDFDHATHYFDNFQDSKYFYHIYFLLIYRVSFLKC